MDKKKIVCVIGTRPEAIKMAPVVIALMKQAVQGNAGHATTGILMDTYAHTQDKPRLELTEKIEADFYTQDVVDAKPQEPPENKTPVATKITPPAPLRCRSGPSPSGAGNTA